MSLEELDEIEEQIMAAFAQGGNEAMEDLKSLSQDEAPYDQGDLSRSATVSQEITDKQWRGAVTYDTEYAARQHEERDWKHQDGKKAGYLGDPMRANAQRYHEHIGEAIKKVIDGG